MQDNLSVVKAWIDCYNKHKVREGTTLFTEDATHEEIPEAKTRRGREEIGAGMEEVLTGFPDLDTRIVNSVVAGDKVAVEVRWRGTHRGEFRGSKPSGKGFTLDGVFVLELHNGKIKKVREYYDTGLLAKQLG